MSPNLQPGQSAPFSVSGVKADGTPSGASLSNLQFASSDPTIFTVAPDPSNPSGGIVTILSTAKAPSQANVAVSAVATDTNGAVSTVFGSDVVNVVAGPPVQPSTTGLAFTWGALQLKK